MGVAAARNIGAELIRLDSRCDGARRPVRPACVRAWHRSLAPWMLLYPVLGAYFLPTACTRRRFAKGHSLTGCCAVLLLNRRRRACPRRPLPLSDGVRVELGWTSRLRLPMAPPLKTKVLFWVIVEAFESLLGGHLGSSGSLV